MPRHLLLLMPFLFGCASSGPTASATPQDRRVISISTQTGTVEIERYFDRRGTTHRVSAPLSDVWPPLVAGYEDLEIPLGTVNRPAGVIGNAKLVATRRLAGQRLSRLLNCGATATGTPVADSYRLEVSRLSELKPVAATESTLQTQVSALAFSSGTSTASVQCVSSGAFEELLLRQIMLQMARDLVPSTPGG